jgi:hypothetical protein
LTEWEERSAIAIGSNEAFSAWTKTFTDPRPHFRAPACRAGRLHQTTYEPRRSRRRGAQLRLP